MIAVFRNFRWPAQKFQVPSIDRSRQIIHLVAGIVDIVFCLDVIAGGPQEIDQGAAVGGAAAMTDVKAGPSGLALDILDLNRIVFAQRAFP